MAKRITNDEFLSKVGLRNNSVIVVGKYVNAKTKVEIECRKCHNKWFALPSSILGGHGCPECAKNAVSNKLSKSPDNFIRDLEHINPNIDVISGYKNNYTKVRCRCKHDGTIWNARPNRLLSGEGCPACAGNKRLTIDEFVKRMDVINPNITILSEYRSYKKYVKCKCNIDNHIWFAQPDALLRGKGCPLCKESKGERKIRKYLVNNKIHFEYQKKFNGLLGLGNGQLSYDFYLPEYSMLIEYQGGFHDGSVTGSYQTDADFAKQKEHDNRKRSFAKDHNYSLLEIWYWDFDNIELILKNALFGN